MNTLLLALLIAAVPEPHSNSGVIVPEGGFKSSDSRLVFKGAVQEVAGPAQQYAGYLSTVLPPTDRGKWWLILYVDVLTQQESKRLLDDFNQHPALKAIGDWCKLWVIQKGGSVAADARIQANLAGKFSTLPVILLVPNPDDPVFGRDSRAKDGEALGWRYAFVQESYGTDAGLLARGLGEAIRREYTIRGQPCPGPYCPVNPQPGPVQPSPLSPPYSPNAPRLPFPTPQPPRASLP